MNIYSVNLIIFFTLFLQVLNSGIFVSRFRMQDKCLGATFFSLNVNLKTSAGRVGWLVLNALEMGFL